MNKNKASKKSKFDIEPYKPRYIHLYITVGEFLERIEKNPNCIYCDFSVKYALEVLEREAATGIQSEASPAREILKHAGLKAFVPKNSRGQKTKDRRWNWWRNNEDTLFSAIKEHEKMLLPIWKDYKANEQKTALKEMVYRVCTKKRPPDELVDALVKEFREKEDSVDLTKVALFLFSKLERVSYSSLRGFYYDPEVSKRREEKKNRKGATLAELGLDRLPQVPLE